MHRKEKGNWLSLTLQLKGSVIPEILPRVTICGIFGLLISGLHQQGLPLSFPVLGSLIPNLVLGLLLVFRTNTAYERFWDGRKAWGNIVNHVRNLARQILVSIQVYSPQDQEEKIAALYLLAAFAIAMKLHLRAEPINEELEKLLTSSQYKKLERMNHPPLEIMFWLGNYLQEKYKCQCVDVYQLTFINQLVNAMVDALGTCERIQKTPIPLAYAIHLKQLLLIYCLSLPFQMVQDLSWLTAPVVALISFTLLGIEEIGIQIEDPFGRDANDLPLDLICNNILRNINDLIDVGL